MSLLRKLLLFLLTKMKGKSIQRAMFLLKKELSKAKWEYRQYKTMQYLFNFTVKKRANISKRHRMLCKSLENIYRGLFRTQSNIYYGVFSRKWLSAERITLKELGISYQYALVVEQHYQSGVRSYVRLYADISKGQKTFSPALPFLFT